MYLMIDKAILKFKWLNYKQKIEQSSLHSTECFFRKIAFFKRFKSTLSKTAKNGLEGIQNLIILILVNVPVSNRYA